MVNLEWMKGRWKRVTNSQTMFTTEVSISTAESKTSNTGVVDCSTDSCESVLGGFDVDVLPESASFGLDSLRLRIDGDFTHLGEIDHEAVLDGSCSRG